MRVFVSYRRRDTADFAGRLAVILKLDPRIDEVFFDVNDIHPGDEFPVNLETALSKCDVVVAVIGPDWRGSGPDPGASRILEDGDFVRQEVAFALRTSRRVVPVLARGAAMPEKADLPDDLVRLAKIQAVAIRHESFERDVEFLLTEIFSHRNFLAKFVDFYHRDIQFDLIYSILGMTIAALLLVCAAVIVNIATGGLSLSEIFGVDGQGPATLLMLAVLAAGAILPLVIRRRIRR